MTQLDLRGLSDPSGGLSHLELYKQQIKKLYPNIGEEEFNKKVEDFEADMAKQAGRFRENELDGTYRESEGWVKLVPKTSA
jgi:hypothetical protein